MYASAFKLAETFAIGNRESLTVTHCAEYAVVRMALSFNQLTAKPIDTASPATASRFSFHA